MICDIKNVFDSIEVFNIYSACMFMPTYQKFSSRAQEFVNNNDVFIFGYFENKKLVGIINIIHNKDNLYEIKGIAVDNHMQKNGIGRQLINYVTSNLSISTLIAETDDDAVQFYKRCGFQIKESYKKFKGKAFKRYKCTLNVKSN